MALIVYVQVRIPQFTLHIAPVITGQHAACDSNATDIPFAGNTAIAPKVAWFIVASASQFMPAECPTAHAHRAPDPYSVRTVNRLFPADAYV